MTMKRCRQGNLRLCGRTAACIRPLKLGGLEPRRATQNVEYRWDNFCVFADLVVTWLSSDVQQQIAKVLYKVRTRKCDM